jgi:hypothetical protein
MKIRIPTCQPPHHRTMVIAYAGNRLVYHARTTRQIGSSTFRAMYITVKQSPVPLYSATSASPS